MNYGSYEVVAALGEGGMASVVKATDSRDGTVVALKILSRDRRADVPGLRDRLRREADVLKALSSVPAVVGMVEVFEDEQSGADVLVLEFVEGETLSSRYQRTEPDVLTVVEWMGRVCHAMHDIHQAGYVHRDLKPDNLLVTDDPELPMRIIDFNSAGLATKKTGQLTRTQGAFPHTPAYLAPECFDGVPPDESADVYALGMTFAELLLGEHPLLPGDDGATTQSMWQEAHQERAFPKLARIPSELQDVLQRATAKERSERTPDAMVLWEELKAVWDALNAPEPASMPVTPVSSRSMSWLTIPLFLWAVAASAGCLVGSWGWFTTANELARAQDENVGLIVDLKRLHAEKTKPLPAPVAPSLVLTPKPAAPSIPIKVGGLMALLEPAKAGDRVTVEYVCTLEDGTVVDQTKDSPLALTLGRGQVIPGLEQRIIGMRPGEHRRIVVPPELGYGSRGRGKIPPNSTLIFELKLVSRTKP